MDMQPDVHVALHDVFGVADLESKFRISKFLKWIPYYILLNGFERWVVSIPSLGLGLKLLYLL